jgi:hypothetical protein
MQSRPTCKNYVAVPGMNRCPNAGLVGEWTTQCPALSCRTDDSEVVDVAALGEEAYSSASGTAFGGAAQSAQWSARRQE